MLCGQSSIDDLENALFSGRKHLSVDRQGEFTSTGVVYGVPDQL
jgi:hypothetical protein